MSGYFPAQHGVKYTLEADMEPPAYPQVPLPTPSTLANIATVMSAAGYNVIYKGKWHCSKPAGAAWSPSDLSAVRVLAVEPGRRRRQPEPPRDGRGHREQRRPLHDVGGRLRDG